MHALDYTSDLFDQQDPPSNLSEEIIGIRFAFKELIKKCLFFRYTIIRLCSVFSNRRIKVKRKIEYKVSLRKFPFANIKETVLRNRATILPGV